MKAFCGGWVKIINGCMVILLVASAVLYPPPVSAAPHAALIASGNVQADPAETRMPETEALLSEATLSAPPLEVVSTETAVPSEIASTEMVVPSETSTPVPTERKIPTATQTNTPTPSETNVPAMIETSLPDPSETLSALQTPDSSPTATMEVPVGTLPDATLAVQMQTPHTAENTMKIQSVPGMLNSNASVNNKIVAGNGHTCFLTTVGGVKCWGWNNFGQLGDGTTTWSTTPVDVIGLDSGVVAIAASGIHTCALTTGGAVKCWGYNFLGQLGDGTTTDRSIPLDVSGLSNGVVAIAAGVTHTCAVTTSGGVKCWGYNGNGQLGNGTTGNSWIPIDVSGLNNRVTAIATGGDYTCALMTSGGIKCWGWNGYGVLGDGTTTDHSTPVDVSGLSSGVAAIAAGYDHICALTTDGNVKCWGYNENSQLGDGTTTNRSTPIDISGLGSDVAAIAAGVVHTCAVTTGGVIKCWGGNDSGQLGDGTITDRQTPVNISGLSSRVFAITASYDHTCALTASDGIKCWGSNVRGGLGDGTTNDSWTPVGVIGFSSPDATILISPSDRIRTNLPVFVWNAVPNTTDYRLSVENVSGEIINQWFSASQVECGSGSGREQCLLDSPTFLSDGDYTWRIQTKNNYWDGDWSNELAFTIYTGSCWSMNLTSSPWWAGNPLVTNTSAKCSAGKFAPGEIVQINPGTHSNYNFSHWSGDFTDTGTEFIMSDRDANVSAWFIRSEAPIMNKIAAGNSHTCGLTMGGAVKCWGYNGNGQLGNGTYIDSTIPVDVSGLGSGVAAIAASVLHTCALTTSGGVKCWGNNSSGQLGDGTNTHRLIAVDVNSLGNEITAIATGYYHTCALTAGGGVKCWGSGKLGDDTTSEHLTPVDVNGLGSGVIAIAAGGEHTCALTTDGAVKCWGDNGSGQLGDGTTINRLTPVYVSGLSSGAVAITASYHHTCALTTNGGVKCWGYNAYGQLGNGTTTSRLTPVNVSGLGSGVIAITANDFHTCVLMTGRGMKCWGSNSNGELGDGTTTWSTLPVDVSGLDRSVAVIAAGRNHTCALTTGGGVKCWGQNWYGQLGDGTTTNRLDPAGVIGYAPPYATNLISPSDNTNSNQPTFVWEAIPDTTDYRLSLNNSSGEILNQLYSADQVNCSSGSGQCSLVSPSVLLDGNYTWKVRTKNSYGDGDWSSEGNFTIFTGSCWSLNLFANPNNGGTPSASPLKSTVCSSNGQYIEGAAITLLPGTNSSYTFSGWTGATVISNVLTMPASTTAVTANYTVAPTCYPMTLSANPSGGGTPTASPANSNGCSTGRYIAGETLTLSPGTKPRYIFSKWTGATVTSNRLTMPASAKTVTANYTDSGGLVPLLPKVAITNSRPTYTWTAAVNATAYDLYIDNSLAQTFTPTSANCATVTRNCTATPARYLKAGIHNWKVTARNTYGSATSILQPFIQLSPIYGFDSQFNGSMSGLLNVQGTWLTNTTSLYSNTLSLVAGPVPGPHYQASIYYNANFTTLDYQVQVMRSGCDTCATKLFVRGDGIPVFAGWKNGYQFNIKRNGYYYVGKTVNGNLITLKGWTPNSAIKTGNNWNLLRVVASGSSLKFYINNIQVWSGNDTARSVGRVGMGLYSNGTGGVNRLYVNYATLTTTVLSAPRADNSSQTQDMTKPEKIDPLGGNY